MISTVASLLLEICTVLSGFIVPRLLIGQYSSSAYGLITTTTQLMSYLMLLQTGVGTVVRTALYKPLAERNAEKLSGVLRASESFFRKMALATVAYTAALIFVFPLINDEFSFLYTASMISIVALGTLLQYYFGITYQTLLQADQRSYIYSLIQLGLVLANIALVYILVVQGASIHVVKLASVLIFAVRPVFLHYYAKHHYKFDKHVPLNKTLLAQRKDAVGQAVAFFIHTKTDLVVITVFLNLTYVAVYSIYAMVTTGLNVMIHSISHAVQATLGNMIAKGEDATLKRQFSSYLTLVHCVTTLLFATAAVLVMPFMRLYTHAFGDKALFIQPTFAMLLLAAEAMFCYRVPYHTLIMAAGHFRQTRNGAFVEAALNIGISIVLVRRMGLTGVAIGTLVAMIYRMLDYVVYLSRSLIHLPLTVFAKHMLVNAVSVFAACAFGYLCLSQTVANYAEWVGMGLLMVAVTAFLTIGLNLLVFPSDMRQIAQTFLRALGRKNHKIQSS